MSRETRDDPYKSFKFVVALVAVGAIAVRIGRKLFARAELVHPGVYVEEIPTGTRPIEGVGTSTDGSTDRKLGRSSRRAGGR
jgi:hypothetical protein